MKGIIIIIIITTTTTTTMKKLVKLPFGRGLVPVLRLKIRLMTLRTDLFPVFVNVS